MILDTTCGDVGGFRQGRAIPDRIFGDVGDFCKDVDVFWADLL